MSDAGSRLASAHEGNATFATRALAWFDRHGRRDLPWQSPRSAYRVWLSEVMLQQTQVATVLPYFARFVERFPDVETLAAAPADEVMRLWAGLGYYARARNLHAAAQAVVREHGGAFPAEPDVLQSLAGVGRSTAGAIAAQAFGVRAAILDANVKRLLSRWAGVDGRPDASTTLDRLWRLSESLLPQERLADYTQALMDLGATVCMPRLPACARCPLRDECVALATGRVAELPMKKPKRLRPLREAWLLLLSDAEQRVLLQRRPPSGVWGGLWAPPIVPLDEDWRDAIATGFGLTVADAAERGEIVEHGFTHFDYRLHVLRIRVQPSTAAAALAEAGPTEWRHRGELAAGALALPAPIRRHFESPQQASLALPRSECEDGYTRRTGTGGACDNPVRPSIEEHPPMPRTVHCIKANAEVEGLERAPMPGALGQRIHEQVGREAWKQWLAHQTRLINEYRLVLADPKARAFLTKELEAYFFGSGELTQTGYTPPPPAD